MGGRACTVPQSCCNNWSVVYPGVKHKANHHESTAAKVQSPVCGNDKGKTELTGGGWVLIVFVIWLCWVLLQWCLATVPS
jgi:hypothetical protein